MDVRVIHVTAEPLLSYDEVMAKLAAKDEDTSPDPMDDQYLTPDMRHAARMASCSLCVERGYMVSNCSNCAGKGF